LQESETIDSPHSIVCEICGKKILEDGDWIDKTAGVCCGPCERELCGDCAEWDVNGECRDCRNEPCGQCFAGSFRHKEDVCQNCECNSLNG